MKLNEAFYKFPLLFENLTNAAATQGNDLENIEQEVQKVTRSQFYDTMMKTLDKYKERIIFKKMIAIEKMLTYQDESINFDKIYATDLEGELAQGKVIPILYKFFKYFDDEIFMVKIDFGLGAWDDDTFEWTKIEIDIRALDENNEIASVFWGACDDIGKVYFDNRPFDEEGMTETKAVTIPSHVGFNYDLIQKCQNLVYKIAEDFETYISMLPRNKDFVREHYWRGEYDFDGKILVHSETFSRPMVKWLNR